MPVETQTRCLRCTEPELMAKQSSNASAGPSSSGMHSPNKSGVEVLLDSTLLQRKASETVPKRKAALRWVTTTHPDQVKDKETMRSIRAHALKNSDYHQKRKKKVKSTAQSDGLPKDTQNTKLTSCQSVLDVPIPNPDLHDVPVEFNSNPSPGNSTCSSSDSAESLPRTLNTAFPTPLNVRPRTTLVRRLSIEDLLNPDHMETIWQDPMEDGPKAVDEWSGDMSIAETDIARNPGSAIDPFRTLPQFSNSRVHVEQLQYFCTMLRNDSWGAQHEKLSMNSRLVYLSSVCAGAAYREAFYGISGESLTSAAVKAEVINMINERLRDPVLQADDETIAAVCHMINFEVFHSEPRLVTHIRGLEQLILQRGGLDQFTTTKDGAPDDSAELITRGLRAQSRVMGGLLVNELQPDPRWKQFVPRPPRAEASKLVRFPESPAHGIKLANSMLPNHCAPETFKLLCDMQTLTSMLFDLEAAGSNPSFGRAHGPSSNTKWPDLQDNTLARAIYEELLALPSATLPYNRLHGDWVYECCRLISLVYATAVIRRIPFSAAAPLAAVTSSTPHILLKLYAALRRTDLENCWGNMSGCLFWVSTVACPATHLPNGATRTPEEDLAKKWFIMVAIRANALPARKFGHGDVNDAAMRLLLKVQAAISW